MKIVNATLPLLLYVVNNLGDNNPENLLDYVDIIQQELVRAGGVLLGDYNFEEHKELVPMQASDVPITYADAFAIEQDFSFKISTSLGKDLRQYAEWNKEFEIYQKGLK